MEIPQATLNRLKIRSVEDINGNSLDFKIDGETLVVSRATERGELQKELMEHLNVSRAGKFTPLNMSRMGLMLEKIPTDALYALVSKCKDAGNRNKKDYFGSYSKTFYWEIRARKI